MTTALAQQLIPALRRNLGRIALRSLHSARVAGGHAAAQAAVVGGDSLLPAEGEDNGCPGAGRAGPRDGQLLWQDLPLSILGARRRRRPASCVLLSSASRALRSVFRRSRVTTLRRWRPSTARAWRSVGCRCDEDCLLPVLARADREPPLRRSSPDRPLTISSGARPRLARLNRPQGRRQDARTLYGSAPSPG